MPSPSRIRLWAVAGAALVVAGCNPSFDGLLFRTGQVWWTLALGIAVVFILASFEPRSGEASLPGGWPRLQAALDGDTGFRRAVALAVLLYLTLALLYALRLPLADDELSGAAEAFQHRTLLPYRDFQPYKTVLGYYLQSLPLYLTRDLWTGIVLIRVEMALLTAATLAFAAFSLRRHFRGAAVCLALGLLVVTSTFLERSFVVRVDMATSLFGLLALLSLLDRRAAVAGLLAGLSGLASQKGIFYILAADAALGVWWLVRRNARAFRELARFNLAALGVLALYFAFWSSISSFEQVVPHVFQTGVKYGLKEWPLICPRTFWLQTLSRNPAFYGTALFALVRLGQRLRRERRHRDGTLWVFGGSMLLLSVWYQQPCPNFFVLLIPTLFVVTVSLFDHELGHRRWQPVVVKRLLALYLVAGLLFPLTRLQVTLARDSGFQRNTVRLAQALLQDGGTYLASLPLLYDRDQALQELAWLDDIRRRQLKQRSDAELRELIADLDRTPLKLIVANYRMWDVPPPLLDYFYRNYDRFWGNIYLYAPQVAPEQRQLTLKFDGHYRIELEDPESPAVIDSGSRAHGQLVRLAAGAHAVASASPCRLRWMPGAFDRSLLDPRYRESQQLFDMSFHY